MSATELLNVPYTLNALSSEQTLDLFLTGNKDSKLLIFIHGGAWRTGDKSQHHDLAQSLVSRNVSVALINYRLSTIDPDTQKPKVTHPSHCLDVFAALEYLYQRSERLNEFPNHSWTLVGHSVGAWLICSLFGRSVSSSADESHHHPKPMPILENEKLRKSIRHSILVDGIYSIQGLLSEYPSYASFVHQAFLSCPSSSSSDHPPNQDSIDQYVSSSLESWSLDLSSSLIHLWHSRDDELLSFKQSIDALVYLDSVLSSDHTAIDGNHTTTDSDSSSIEKVPTDGLASYIIVNGEKKSVNEVYPTLSLRSSNSLYVDFVSLRKSHDDLIHTQTFWDNVYKVTTLP